MGDPKSDLIFSIDPGIVNIGVACYNGATKEVVFADKMAIAPSMKDLQRKNDYIPRLYKLFYYDDGPLRHLIDKSRMVVIEIQMTRNMLIVQNIIGTILFCHNIEYMFVSPQRIKTFFDTGARGRALAGLSVVGKKNNHAKNKKTGIKKAKELFPDLMSSLSVQKQDDVADALLQACWYSSVYSHVGHPSSFKRTPPTHRSKSPKPRAKPRSKT